MDALFSQLTLTDVRGDVLRNIVSIRVSQNLFDDLSSSPEDWALAQRVEDAAKPPPYQSHTPVIHRPFEDAEWFNALWFSTIGWPFKHWQASRFSNGAFGVWYGAGTAETTVYETAYHWFSGLLTDAGFERESVVGERKVYQVACAAALVDLRPVCATHAGLMHKIDYTLGQAVGARLHREGHPGLVTASVRDLGMGSGSGGGEGGTNYVILNPSVLSNPRHHCHLSYRLDGPRIVVEKQPGVAWMTLDTTLF
jgi:RES domain